MTRGRLIIGAAVVAMALGAAAWGSWRYYFEPAQEKQKTLASRQRLLDAVEDELKGRFTLRDRLDRLGAVMIAGPSDEFEHRLRSGLAAIAREAELSNVSLGNGSPSPVTSPILRERGSGDLGRALRGQRDFAVVRGWMTGQGTLAQVTNALASVQAQAWIHRVESFAIKPTNPDRTRFELRVDFATLVMDGADRKITEPWALAPAGEGSLAYAGEIVKDEVFGAPPKQAPTVAIAPPALAPTPPPYEQWKVTGLVEGREVEAMLVNDATGERKVLERGQSVLDAVFEDGSGERTVFSIGGLRHEVTVGQTLADRRPTQ